MKGTLSLLFEGFRSLWRQSHSRAVYRGVATDELPDLVRDGVLYAIGKDGVYWQAALKCPCDCGSIIQLPLDSSGTHSSWKLSKTLEQPTLFPSVWRTVGCRSHFWLRRGAVEWCKERGLYNQD